MLKSIFIFLVSLIGLPLYAVCVVILYVIGAAFGIKPYAFPPPQRALRETMHQLHPRQKEMKFK